MPFIKVGNLNIHYQISGQGEPLVCLHGMGNNSDSWSNQLDGLSRLFTVIAWDAPGYGQSSDPPEPYQNFMQFADILKQFLDAMQLQAVNILGHSMGAAIAVEFAVSYPKMIKSLILADITRGAAALNQSENERKLQQRLNSIDTKDPKEIADERIHALLAPQTSNEIREKVRVIMSKIRPIGYKSVAYSLFHLNQMEIYRLIQSPTLIICGEIDQVTPVHESRIVHEQIADSRLEIIPKTGHLCYQEDPTSFNNLVFKFLSHS